MGNRPARERQIRLIGEIGAALDVYVGKPLIRSALTMMRTPARMAGFGVLHDFLDRGFNAFRRMDGAEYFLATIVARETALMDAMFGGETAPFTDPLRSGARPAAARGDCRRRRQAFLTPKRLSNSLCTSFSIAGLIAVSRKPSLQSSSHFVLVHDQLAGEPRPRERDAVAVPLVVEGEALVQVLGDLLRGFLRLLVRQVVLLGDRDRGHGGSR